MSTMALSGKFVANNYPKAIALWMARRYLADELGLYAHIISQSWYPLVKFQVARAEATRSKGEHKRVFAENAVRAYLLDVKQPIPRDRDLQLAIELAVREMR